MNETPKKFKKIARLNADQAKHFADFLRNIGLGQLAYFGYKAIEADGGSGAFLLSGAITLLCQAVALALLRDRPSD